MEATDVHMTGRWTCDVLIMERVLTEHKLLAFDCPGSNPTFSNPLPSTPHPPTPPVLYCSRFGVSDPLILQKCRTGFGQTYSTKALGQMYCGVRSDIPRP